LFLPYDTGERRDFSTSSAIVHYRYGTAYCTSSQSFEHNKSAVQRAGSLVFGFAQLRGPVLVGSRGWCGRYSLPEHSRKLMIDSTSMTTKYLLHRESAVASLPPGCNGCSLSAIHSTVVTLARRIPMTM
jgi:hypothetical protein